MSNQTLNSKINDYIPLDKSWTMRMAILDLLDGQAERSLQILKGEKFLSDDLVALKRVLGYWDNKNSIDVGESGTLYRFLQFISWKQELNKKFVKHGTLENRDICNNPKITGYPLEKLLKLDNGTSQWASAAVLCGNKESIKNPPFKLAITYKAVKQWNENKNWVVLRDQTIQNQALSFINILKNKPEFTPNHSEDYCFAMAFGFIAAEKGEKLWSSLKGHESNRIVEMEKALDEYKDKKAIASKDHRVVQAIAMKGKTEGRDAKFKFPAAVNKTWPQFWSFLEKSSDR